MYNWRDVHRRMSVLYARMNNCQLGVWCDSVSVDSSIGQREGEEASSFLSAAPWSLWLILACRIHRNVCIGV